MSDEKPKPIQFAKMPDDLDDRYVPCACSYEEDYDGTCDCKPMTVREAREMVASLGGLSSVAKGTTR